MGDNITKSNAGIKSMRVGQDYNEESAAEGNLTNTGTAEQAKEEKGVSLKSVAVTEKTEEEPRVNDILFVQCQN